MSSCPCCSGNLLRHIRTEGIYWMCLRCRQEMPMVNNSELSRYAQERLEFTAERSKSRALM